MRCWKFETMFPSDLAEAVRSFPVAWLSLSPLEWHGEALALGCDPILGYELSRQAWEKTGGVLLPPLYVGTGNNFAKAEGDGDLAGRWERETVVSPPHPGSIFVRPVTVELVLLDTMYFLEREGFRLCVVVSGHGAIDHMMAILRTCEAFNAAVAAGKGTMRAYCWRGDGVEIPEELRYDGAGDHADFPEASALGGVDPKLVDVARFGIHQRDRSIGILSENASRIDFDKGRRVFAIFAQNIASEVGSIIKEMGIPVQADAGRRPAHGPRRARGGSSHRFPRGPQRSRLENAPEPR